MRNENFVTNLRASVVKLLEARDELRSHKIIWDSQALGDTLEPEDLSGDNADLTVEDVDGFITSTTAIDQFITQGFHDTPLQKARP